ncbi:hypothetical protein Y032_0078g1208 [Ancylostoma ceylanicum]|nr:hypothetical protein Y032_0078g1208 [Ancylostoma ceylanicum]
MEDLSQLCEKKGLGRSAVAVLLASWAANTRRQYESSLKKWYSFLVSTDTPPREASIAHLCNFLAAEAEKGRSYATVSLSRSAICTVTDLLLNKNWSSDPLVARFMKGLYRRNPPKPKYASTWDVDQVLGYITSLGSNQTLSLKMLSLKLVALLALCSPKRVSEIAALSLTSLERSEGRWTFHIDYRNKNRRSGAPQTAVYERFPDDPRLCPVKTLVAYLEATECIRKGENRLLISYSRPHRAITASTVGRWIKWVLREAGVDTSFTAHSTRSASTSKAMREGVSLALIMKAASWSEKGNTFQKFYCREVENSFQKSVLRRFDSDYTSRSRRTAGVKEEAKPASTSAKDTVVKQRRPRHKPEVRQGSSAK